MWTEKPRIFDYVDYRKFLADYYAWNKKRDPSFSLRYFSAQAGLKSFNYLKLVIDGDRRITETFFEPFCKALKLAQGEREYFARLIEFTDETETDRRAELLEHLLKLRPASDFKSVEPQKIHLCQEWHYIPLIELTETEGFVCDDKWIAERLQISVPDARRAIKALVSAGYLEEKGGTLVKAHRIAAARDEFTDLILQRYHSQNLAVAARKIFEQPIEEREYGSISFSVDAAKIARLKQKMKDFQKEFFSILDEPSPKGSEVYQMNMQLFRVSEKARAPQAATRPGLRVKASKTAESEEVPATESRES